MWKTQVILKVGNSLLWRRNMAQQFVDNAKVMAKGQVTIPKDVRAALGVGTGDHVTFLVDGTHVLKCYS